MLQFHRDGMFLCTHPTDTSALQTIEIGGPLTMPRTLTVRSDDRRQADNSGILQTTISPDVVFGADTERLYWFENRLIELQRGENVTRQPSKFSVWTTDMRGDDRRNVLSLSLPVCSCPTESCEESCPEIRAWAPDEGVRDFFFLTKWTPGQIESDFLETRLYQRRSGRWTGRVLPHVIEIFLDAKQHGEMFVWAINDGGCCGWNNVSNDQTFITVGSKETTIFDERARFKNPNYDVRFFTPTAKLSPSAARVAYTVAATAKPVDQIRLADQGKPNAAELTRIKRAIAELPRVEVQEVA